MSQYKYTARASADQINRTVSTMGRMMTSQERAMLTEGAQRLVTTDTDTMVARLRALDQFVAGYNTELWSLIDDLATMLAATRTGIVYDDDVAVLLARYQDTNRMQP